MEEKLGPYELNKIYHMDCFEMLKKIPDKSIDLVIIDPPYFKVMIKDWFNRKYEWDSQWGNIKEYQEWIFKLGEQIKRILKNNGSFYIFADHKNCAYVQIELDKLFHLENVIIWVKTCNITRKGWRTYRCFVPVTERILFYSNEGRNRCLKNLTYVEYVKVLEPIIKYMIEQKEMIKKYFMFKTDSKFKEFINKIMNNVMSRHYFSYSQWQFPTKEQYEKLQSINNYIFKEEYKIFKTEYHVFKKQYDDLKKQYENLRRPFHQDSNFTDVWYFAPVISKKNFGEHPTQKPINIIKRIINTSSRENDIVLDCFIGTGTTALACKETNRKFIGCELNAEYVKIAEQRISQNN